MSDFRTDSGAAGRRHADLAPELRLLAQSILDRLDPAVRFAAARATSGGQGGCRQVWCPVCAIAAVVTGEQHPLLTVVAEHGVALLDVIRAMVNAMDTGAGSEGGPVGPDPSPPPGPGPGRAPSPSGPGHYQHIRVTVED